MSPDSAEKPLLLVDVDGVISLFGFASDRCPAGTWARIDGTAHLLSSEAAAHLLDLVSDFDLVWCTGWEERADEHLPHLLGLPRLPWLSFDRDPGRTRAHWKLGAIDAHAGPSRPVAWIDDALDAHCEDWAEDRRRAGGPTLLVHTAPEAGLTLVERDVLRTWARELASQPVSRR